MTWLAFAHPGSNYLKNENEHHKTFGTVSISHLYFCVMKCIIAGSDFFSFLSPLLDGGFESVTRIVCSPEWPERMLLFAKARNNGTQRAPVTQDQASRWIVRRREKICASSAPLTFQDSSGI